jgi:nucleolar protein 14
MFQRRKTLLPELQGRNKTGIIIDRRFGEDDPTMTAEDRARERFVREKRSAMFDLEEDTSYELTHAGKTLNLGGGDMVDDFDEDDLGSDGESSEDERKRQRHQRREDELARSARAEDRQRPKTKKEIMSEVIAKSKLYKQERQLEKDSNDQLKNEVYAQFPELQSLLAKAVQDRQSVVAADDASKASKSKELDIQLRELSMLPRVQVSSRTKTDDEIAEEQREKLKEVEEQRQKRMLGEEESESGEESQEDEGNGEDDVMAAMFTDEVDNFGLGNGIKSRPTATELGLDDEDDFFIEDDLIASDSDPDVDDSGSEAGETDGGKEDAGIEEDDDIFSADELEAEAEAGQVSIPSTLPCPQSYEQLMHTISPYPRKNLPTIIQRIRAQYNFGLDSKNKERVANFARALVDYVAAPLDAIDGTTFAVLEGVIRHIHSLAKKYPIEVAQQCRAHLESMSDVRPTSLEAGDLVLLTSVGSIFPTSDHFHQVITPAMLCIGRYLGQKIPRCLADYATGTYLGLLAIHYQRLSKRYIPELMNFSLNTLCALAAVPSGIAGGFPLHPPLEGTRISKAQSVKVRKLSLRDCIDRDVSDKNTTSCKVAIISTNIGLLENASDIWSGKPAFLETFDPMARVLRHLASTPCRSECPQDLNEWIDKVSAKAERGLKVAELSRRTLELHHHRPIPIKTYDPKWEDNFDPTKHYDPDKDRADMAKLKAELKRERKGALNELRKDARFLAREKLKMQKAKDEAYDKKMKRTIAEIQSEGGREANEYAREVNARKRARTRR